MLAVAENLNNDVYLVVGNIDINVLSSETIKKLKSKTSLIDELFPDYAGHRTEFFKLFIRPED